MLAPYGGHSAPPRKCAPDRSATNSRWARPARSGQSIRRKKSCAPSSPSQQLRLEAAIQRQDADEAGTVALRHSIEETRAQLDAIRVRQGGVAATQTSLPGVAGASAAPVAAGHGGARLFRRRQQRARLAAHAQRAASCRSARPRPAATSRRRRGGVATRRHAGTPAAQSRFDVVRATCSTASPRRRMLVLADGPLNGVPFAALPVPGAGGELLVDRFVLGYAPSLALAMDKARPAKTRNTRVAVVSDPVYAADDRRLSVARSGERRHAAQRSAALAKQPDAPALFGARGERGYQGIRIGRHHRSCPASRPPPRACCNCHRASSRCCTSRPTPRRDATRPSNRRCTSASTRRTARCCRPAD